MINHAKASTNSFCFTLGSLGYAWSVFLPFLGSYFPLALLGYLHRGSRGYRSLPIIDIAYPLPFARIQKVSFIP